MCERRVSFYVTRLTKLLHENNRSSELNYPLISTDETETLTSCGSNSMASHI